MRICMIAASFLPTIGGSQFQVKYLTEALAEKGVEVFLLSYSDGQRFLDLKNNGFPKFFQLKNKNLILGAFELYRLIKKNSPDIIHIHMAERQAFQVVFLKSLGAIKQPLLITSHGVDIMTSPGIGYGLRLKPLNNLIIKYILKKSAKHIIVGKSMKDYALEAGSTQDKIIEINNGIPLDKKEISQEKFSQILNKFGISLNEPVLLSLSGLRPLKGIEYLIKATPKILKEFPEAKLILACKSDQYEKYVRTIVDSLGLKESIRFIGFIDNEEEKIVLLRRADVFCKPSILEACSVAILEAMREGKAIVASLPAGIDIITDNRNGLLCKVKNPGDFADKVIKILKDRDLKIKIEKNAKEDVKNFDIKKIADQYIFLYKNIL